MTGRRYRTNRLLLGIALFIAWLSPGTMLVGQWDPEVRLELFRNENGHVVDIYFAGSADWLVRQADERSHWHKYTHLRGIDIGHTRVTREQLQFIASLESVRLLSIDCLPQEVEISGGALSALQEMTWLEELYLVDDGFSEDDWAFLSKLTNLKKLSINGTITDGTLHRIARLDALEEFTCRGVSNLSNETAQAIASAGRLSSAGFGEVPEPIQLLRLLAAANNLKRLVISAPHIGDEGAACIAQMSKLEHLELEGLDPKATPRLESLANLKFLRIWYERGDELDDLEFLSEFDKLSFLVLTKASIRNPSLESIRDRRHLEHLALSTITFGGSSYNCARSRDSRVTRQVHILFHGVRRV